MRAWLPLLVLLSCAGVARAQDASQLDCMIEPHAVTEVATREEGVLERLLVRRGESVRAGQVVAKLESDLEQARVDLMRARSRLDGLVREAQVQSDYAARQLERAEGLFAKNSIPDTRRDEAETEALRAEARLAQARQRQKVAELELAQARKQLAKRTIRSPLDGIVVERMLEIGESVKDKPILSIAQTDPLSVELIVPADRYGSIEVGMRGEVVPELPGSAPRSATVTIVDRVIDAASGTFGVQLELPNPDRALPSGIPCRFRLLTEQAASNAP